MAGQALTHVEKLQNVRDLLETNKGSIAQALPKHLSAERFARVAFMSVRKTPRLLECDPRSLISAIMNAASLGLEPDNELGHANILPYGKEAKLQIGYRGLATLARRSGEVSDVQARVVYDQEGFEYEEGDNPKLYHKPASPSIRGEVRIGAYSRVLFKDGAVSINFMWAEEIEAIKARSPAVRKKQQTPWTDPDEWVQNEMWKKSVFRNHAKMLNLTPELTRASVIDEMEDLGIPVPHVDEDLIVDGDFIEPQANGVDPQGESDLEIEGEEPETPQVGPDPDEVKLRELGEALGKTPQAIGKEIKKAKEEETIKQKIQEWEEMLRAEKEAPSDPPTGQGDLIDE